MLKSSIIYLRNVFKIATSNSRQTTFLSKNTNWFFSNFHYFKDQTNDVQFYR
jgi:hypothetical protein